MTAITRILVLLAILICGCKRISPVELVDPSRSSVRLVDPGPQFREAFEGVSRIEFLTRDSGCFCQGHGIAAVDQREDIRRFFEIFEFVPYVEGSSERCDWECDEVVRTYINYYQNEEFTIHHRNHEAVVKWDRQATDLKLTAESAAVLDSYLADYDYATAKHERREYRQAPPLRMLPPPAIPLSAPPKVIGCRW